MEARDRLRADIQALRAIAVAAVFAYHLFPGRVTGGFVGVDVFFVISGFLITGNLVREADATGRIDVWRFWSRRMRRLLPASLLVLVVSALATMAVVPGNLWSQFLGEVAASALYVQNWVLAGNSVDYLAAANQPSPVQHFWTLSVEEQFYVATPILLIAVLWAGQRLRSRRRPMLLGLSAVLVASLVWCVWQTQVSPASAYFVTTTRAWEFCVGAMLVFAPPPRTRARARLAVAIGLSAVVAAVLQISGDVPFPGVVAVVPVVGAAALIWGGEVAGGIWARFTAIRAVRFAGDVSYAIYLWHWPLIILAPYVLNHGLGVMGKAAVVALTILLAGLSTRLVEDPIRFSPRLLGGGRRPRTVIAWSAAGMALVVAVTSAGTTVARARAEEARRTTDAVVELLMPSARPSGTQSVPSASGSPTPRPDPEVDASGPAPSVPAPLGLAQCLGAGRFLLGNACDGVIPAGMLVPDPTAAQRDVYNRPECSNGHEDVNVDMCTLGPADAEVRLVAVGDSHNIQYLRAYEWMAATYGWRIDVAAHGGCYWTTVDLAQATRELVEVCNTWKAKFGAWLREQRGVDAVLVTMARGRHPALARAGESVIDATVRGLLEAWTTQAPPGTRIIAIRDDPRMTENVAMCVVSHPETANRNCGRQATDALGPRDALQEAVAAAPDARMVDFTDVYCPDGRCIVTYSGVVIYRDIDHITATWSLTMAPLMGARIAEVLPPK